MSAADDHEGVLYRLQEQLKEPHLNNRHCVDRQEPESKGVRQEKQANEVQGKRSATMVKG